MASAYEIIYYLQAYGIYDYLLPLLLFFTIVFAALEKTMVLGSVGKTDKNEGRPKTNLNIIVSFIIALIVIVNTPVVQFVNNFLSNTGVIIVIAIVFMLFLALFTPNADKLFKEKTVMWIGFILAILAVIWALRTYTNDLPYALYWLSFLGPDTVSWLVALGIIVLVIVLLKSDTKTEYTEEEIRRRR